MKRIIRIAMSMPLLFWISGQALAANPRVVIETSVGNIQVELYQDKAPKSVANFIRYANDKFYDGTIFHRVISGFMVQGGGFTPDFKRKTTRAPIKNEADNGLLNEPGTLAMARTQDPHSATSQFFINTVSNKFLNFKGPVGQGWGYAVFGKVTKGMDVVKKIEATPTSAGGPFPRDVPSPIVVIKRVTVKK